MRILRLQVRILSGAPGGFDLFERSEKRQGSESKIQVLTAKQELRSIPPRALELAHAKMPKERKERERRETYRFRYKDPLHIRRRIVYAERIFQLVKTVQYGRVSTIYQVLAEFTGAEKDGLEKVLEIGRAHV